jgi:antitoxin FitA
MATLIIRNLSDATRRALEERAARGNRSIEAEVRAILESAVGGGSDFVTSWLDAAEGLRGEFEAPPRSPAREIDVS